MSTSQQQKMAYMLGMVDEFEMSGQIIDAFVEKRGITKITLKYWIRKKRELTRTQPRFVELVTSAVSQVSDAGPINKKTSGECTNRVYPAEWLVHISFRRGCLV